MKTISINDLTPTEIKAGKAIWASTVDAIRGLGLTTADLAHEDAGGWLVGLVRSLVNDVADSTGINPGRLTAAVNAARAGAA